MSQILDVIVEYSEKGMDKNVKIKICNQELEGTNLVYFILANLFLAHAEELKSDACIEGREPWMKNFRHTFKLDIDKIRELKDEIVNLDEKYNKEDEQDGTN